MHGIGTELQPGTRLGRLGRPFKNRNCKALASKRQRTRQPRNSATGDKNCLASIRRLRRLSALR